MIVKKIVVVAMTLAFFMFNEAKAQGVIEAGTVITVKPAKQWHCKDKNPPEFVVEYPVKDSNGRTVINMGEPVKIDVNWKKNKGVGKEGWVDISFKSVRAVDGTVVFIRGDYADRGEDRVGLAHGLTWGLFFFIGPLSLPCLAVKGEPVKLYTTMREDTYVVNKTIIK